MKKRFLTPEVEAILSESKEVRIQYAQADKWVGYPIANDILKKMEFLFKAPRTTRVKSMLIVGPSNAGKTSLKKRFIHKHPEVESPDGDCTIFPTLHIEAPPKADTRSFCMGILDACRAPHDGQYFPALSKQVMEVLNETKVRIIIVDEIHNFLVGRQDMKVALLNLIRGISNQLKISFFAFGTPEALKVFYSDSQLSSRFKREFLPKWDTPGNRVVFKKMLVSLEATLPLKKTSNLANNIIMEKLILMSEGILGEVVDILEDATIEAIVTGEEQITPALLDSIGWLTPTEREQFSVDA